MFLRSISRPFARSTKAKVSITVCIAVAYVVAFVVMSRLFGIAAFVLAVVPVITAAWFFGSRVGLLAGFLGFPVNSLVVLLATELEWRERAADGGMLGNAGLALVGWVVGHLRDMTVNTNKALVELGKVEEELRQSEERYRTLVELFPEAVFVHSEGNFEYTNPAGVELFGAANPDELLGTPMIERVHPTAREAAIERIRRMQVAGIRADPMESKGLKLDGQAIEIEVTAAPITYKNKSSILVVIRDITERKQADKHIRRLAVAVETVRDSVVIADMDGCALFANRAAELIFGYAPGEMVGIEVLGLHPESLRETTAHEIFEATAKDGAWTGEVLLQKKTGEEFPARVSTALMTDQDGRLAGMVSITTDVTERRQLQEQLRSDVNSGHQTFHAAGPASPA